MKTANPAPTWRSQFQSTGSLTRRMILTAAAWITILLIGGGAALDRVLVNSVEQNFDNQLEYVLTAMIASAEIGPDGEIRMNPIAACIGKLPATARCRFHPGHYGTAH
jgi:hypothetical protein